MIDRKHNGAAPFPFVDSSRAFGAPLLEGGCSGNSGVWKLGLLSKLGLPLFLAPTPSPGAEAHSSCLLHTSDPADEEDSVRLAWSHLI